MAEHMLLAHPAKVGLGAWSSFGTDRLYHDLGALGANWYYVWGPNAPSDVTASAPALDGWTLGTDIELLETAGAHGVLLGDSADAWLFQDAAVQAGAAYTLSVEIDAGAEARAGAMMHFLDGSGQTIDTHWLPLVGEAGTASLRGAVAPDGAVTARVLLWGESGAVEIGDVSLSDGSTEVLTNGGLDPAVTWGAEADFVHMVWSGADVTPETIERLTGVDTILGFNEPDHVDQSDMTVDEALALWPELMTTGARLGSPSPTQYEVLGEDSWLGRFMEGADAAGYRVDFIAVHYYSDNGDVAAFETFLEEVHAQYGLPIWVTEWALADWFDLDKFTHADNARFFREGAEMMDGLDFVERHAWFGLYDNLDQWSIGANLVHDDGALSEVGLAFADVAAPAVLVGSDEADSLAEPEEEDEPSGGGSTDGSPGDEPDDTGDDGGPAGAHGSGTDGSPTAADSGAPSFQQAATVAQYGTVELDHKPLTVQLDHAFEAPVVIATVNSVNGGQPVSVRVEDVGSDRFSIYLDEPNHLDGYHVPETVSWIVVESGSWIAEGGLALQAGITTTNILSSEGTTPIEFDHAFRERPAIFTTDQTSNGGDMIWTRAEGPGTQGFSLVMEEEERLNPGKHVAEEIGWLAVERADGSVETMSGALVFETSDIGFALDSSGDTIWFEKDFIASPVLLAGISGRQDHDPTGLRIDGLSADGGWGFLQEDTSQDSETAHAPEPVDWLALEGSGLLHGVAADSLMWGA
ncbi:glycosyl hydrolase [Rhodovulum sp. 12E13]|uniref:glycosyl hydrolase n=1 Tax=Rhodovulum sp. 12E13 TaxID=2203891 RepID=UPI001314A72E|nr:glycosyl hydrolase [Rhodovulum sp. 12E13]